LRLGSPSSVSFYDDDVPPPRLRACGVYGDEPPPRRLRAGVSGDVLPLRQQRACDDGGDDGLQPLQPRVYAVSGVSLRLLPRLCVSVLPLDFTPIQRRKWM